MERLGIKLLVIFGTVYAFLELFNVGYYEDTFSLIIFGVILMLINATIKPILTVISIPVTCLTLGLFSLIVNTWMVALADRLVGGVEIYGFWNTMFLAITISIINGIVINKRKEDKHRD